ncbi:MAG TPA: hypothetical protein VE956_23160 [Nodularia sp. (in: cyanobacteria)]|nr:hypothetical protein [Nodularia sp. (in: cyanobacteria)]
MLERAADGSLKTNSRWNDIYGNYFTAFVELIQENLFISGVIGVISFVSAVLGIVTFLK